MNFTKKYHQLAFNNSNEGILIADKNNTIIDVNSSFSKITGYSKKEVLGKSPDILKSFRHDTKFYKQMWEDINTQGKWSGKIYNKKKTGEVYPEHLTIHTIKNKKVKSKTIWQCFQIIL